MKKKENKIWWSYLAAIMVAVQPLFAVQADWTSKSERVRWLIRLGVTVATAVLVKASSNMSTGKS